MSLLCALISERNSEDATKNSTPPQCIAVKALAGKQPQEAPREQRDELR